MKKLLILVLISVFSCQKDFYLEDLNSANSEIDTLNETIQGLTEQNSNLENQNNSLEDENADLSAQLSDLEEDIVLLQQGANQLEVDVASHVMTIEELEEEIQKLKESLSFVTSQWERSMDDLTALEQKLSQDNADYNQQIDNYNQIIEEQRAIISSLTEQITQLADSVETTTTVHEYTETFNVEEEVSDADEVTVNPEPEIPLRNIAPSSEATGFTDDAVYSTIDFDDPYSYLAAFVMDAERYGVDIRFALEQEFTFEWFNKTPQQSDAYAFLCVPNSIYVKYDVASWDSHSRNHSDNTRLWLMWHEFGHAILDYNHSCDRSSIMYSPNSCVGVMTTYSGNNSAWSEFPAAAKNLFESHNIEPYPCGSTSKSLIEPIQIN